MDADENIAYFLNSDLPDSDFVRELQERKAIILMKMESLSSALMSMRWPPDIWEQLPLPFR